MKDKSNIKVNLASQPNEKFRGDNLKERILTLEGVINAKLKTINGLVFRNGGRGLIGLFLKIIRGVRPRSSASVVRQVSYFVFRCNRIAKHSGLKGLVIYLKASQVLLQQSIAGYRVLDLQELKVRPSRNRAGVPLIIPAGVRVLISRDRDIRSIKLWMTLLGLYRILDYKGKLSLSTITDPGLDISSFLDEWEMFLRKRFKPELSKLVQFPKLSAPSVYPILKSGPTTLTLDDPPGTSYTNSSVRALVIAARVWLRKSPDNVLLDALKRYVSQVPGAKTLVSRLQTIALVKNERIDEPNFIGLPLGATRYKREPAGKIRVFAMVDAWTQWLLNPLHKWLFNILRALPQDGTFDQLKPVLRLQSLYKDNPKGLFSSIDLSAATDRLPISMQVKLLEVLLEDIVPDSKIFSEAWRDLLVKREYATGLTKEDIKKRKDMIIPGNIPERVIYSVGQPMGALSSWAMLALTHHAMMQYASFKAGGKGWFSDYAVLGDDGVIKGTNQTNQYTQLLRTIGVKAGLAKSILSKNKFVIEFAKKFFVDSTTANMLPFKESIATLSSTSLVLEFTRKYDLSLNAILSFLGYGYKAKMRVFRTSFFKLSTRLRVLLVWLSHPSSPLGKRTYIEWLLQKSWTESFSPSAAALKEVEKVLARLNNIKFDSIYTSFNLYIKSLQETPDRLDKVTPIEIISMNSNSLGGAMRTADVQLIPWKAVLSDELSDEDVDYDYLSAWNDGGMSSTGYRFKVLKDLKIGIDLGKLHDDFIMEVSNITVPRSMWSEDGTLGPYGGIHLRVHTYFALDDLKAKIPEKFWPENRESQRPFRDFLTMYKYWQEVTKPLWMEFNGKDLSLPIKIPFVKSERGDIEKQVHHQSSSGSFLNFPWVDFLVVATLTFLMLEWLHGGSRSGEVWDPPFLYNIITEETELLPPTEIIFTSITAQQWTGIYMMIAGVLLLTGSIIMSYHQGHPWAWLGIYETEISQVPNVTIQTTGFQEIGDTVMAGNVMISGPLSASSLSLVQIRLENQALLDNLAISPIGDLWISPW